jgi:hypothetical protein
MKGQNRPPPPVLLERYPISKPATRIPNANKSTIRTTPLSPPSVSPRAISSPQPLPNRSVETLEAYRTANDTPDPCLPVPLARLGQIMDQEATGGI